MVTGTVSVKERDNCLVIDNRSVTITIDLHRGTANYRWADCTEMIDVYSAFTYRDAVLQTKDYAMHTVDPDGAVGIQDAFGSGIRLAVVHTANGLPVMKQVYFVYEHLPYFLIRLEVGGEEGAMLETNHIAPIVAESADAGVSAVSIGTTPGKDGVHALFVPFDNDKWVRYSSAAMPDKLESYEVTAIYDPAARNGLVLGSISHDTWKTGLQIHGKSEGGIHRLEVYGGAAGEYTRDSLPHGKVAGSLLSSPLLFVGAFDDYRSGLEEYGRANGKIEPAMPWEGGVPFGWNSWSAAGDKLDYDLYVHTSDFLRKLQDRGFHNKDTVYINFDSFWSNLSAEQLDDAVRHVRQNGQKAGIYWTPFAFWGDRYDRVVEGTDGQYTYGDLLLRDEAGNVLPELDGGLPIDPTHPGNLMRMEYNLERFISWGFEYIKLDFLGHGALEGRHYDPAIRTGIQAYNLGMDYIKRKLDPGRIGRPFFINLSIAPLFPHQYAHSRRISCDAFGTLADTEYMLNALTYGWWINNTVYRFNDPDHTVLYKSFNQGPTASHEGRSRLTASVISGTVLLLGDDFRREEAGRRALAWLGNHEILELARKGKSFVPLEGKAGSGATDVFVLKETISEGGGVIYFAVFNFNAKEKATKRIQSDRLGLEAGRAYILEDLWDKNKASGTSDEALEVMLGPGESKLYKLQLQ
jgi:alpha-galactosidase